MQETNRPNRPAFTERKLECVELHCAGRFHTHNYGDPTCDWVLLADGKGNPELRGKSDVRVFTMRMLLPRTNPDPLPLANFHKFMVSIWPEALTLTVQEEG
jgi:hypothetical protein